MARSGGVAGFRSTAPGGAALDAPPGGDAAEAALFGVGAGERLPRAPQATSVAPAYVVVDWVSQSDGFTPEFPARVHLFDRGPGGFAVVGLERPESFDPPALAQ